MKLKIVFEISKITFLKKKKKNFDVIANVTINIFLAYSDLYISTLF